MENMLKCAIDLLWVRPQKVGGIESYIRNLLDGFSALNDKFEFWLLVSRDNANTFEHYTQDPRFHLHICNVESKDVFKRIVWQNLHLGNEIRKLQIRKCFEPYYCKPIFGTHGISFLTTIHDLQATHYPQYFSRIKVLWMKLSWLNTVLTSKKVIAISEYVKKDILNHYHISKEKVNVIYNPIIIDANKIKDISFLEEKYKIKEKRFYFTVSSLLPHKNINVLLEIIKKIKEEGIDLPQKLIVSGIGGKQRPDLELKIKKYGIEENVQLTAFIDDDERNALYKYCRAFLFPSVFEGFGMPPVEAMKLGTPVLTTRCTCLEEVTQGKANYVDNPYDADEWIDKMKEISFCELDTSKYEKNIISEMYLRRLQSL